MKPRGLGKPISITRGETTYPGRVPDLVFVHDLTRALHHCLAVLFLCLVIFASAVRAELHPAGVAACVPELPGVPVVALTPVLLHRLFAVTVCEGCLSHPADVEQNAGYPAAWNLFPGARVLFPAEPVLLALPAPDGVAALEGHAVDNDNSCSEVHAAAQLVEDTDPLNTAADKVATGQVFGGLCGPIYPNHVYVVPNHDPNAHPNAGAHQTTKPESILAVVGSSAPGFSG